MLFSSSVWMVHPKRRCIFTTLHSAISSSYQRRFRTMCITCSYYVNFHISVISYENFGNHKRYSLSKIKYDKWRCKEESLFWVIVYNIDTALASQYLLSILLIIDRSRRAGTLRALAESSLARIYSHISTSSLDTLDRTRESLLSRVTPHLQYSKHVTI
jgi:hypothetical protein